MPHYYITSYQEYTDSIGNKSFAPKGAGDIDTEWHSIDFRPDCTVTSGKVILAVPVRNDGLHGGRYIGENPLEKFSSVIKNQIGNEFSVSLSVDTFDQILFELLYHHGDDNNSSRWNKLRPTRGRRLEVYLRDKLIDIPILQGGASFSDDFNRADSTNLGSNWTERSGDVKIESNYLTGVSTGWYNWGTWNADHDSSDQQGTCAFNSSINSSHGCAGIILRASSSAATWYGMRKRQNTAVFETLKSVTGSETVISASGSLTWTLGSAYHIYGQVEGSTISGSTEAGSSLKATDTSITTGYRSGYVHGSDVSNNRGRLDNYYAQDVFATSLTYGNNATAQSSWTTASISPTKGSILLLAVTAYESGAAFEQVDVTSGFGLTWTVPNNQGYSGTLGFVSAAWAHVDDDVTPGTISFRFATGSTTYEGIAWVVVEIPNCKDATQSLPFNSVNRTNSADTLTLNALSALQTKNVTVGYFGAHNNTNESIRHINTAGGYIIDTAEGSTTTSHRVAVAVNYAVDSTDTTLTTQVEAPADHLFGGAIEFEWYYPTDAGQASETDSARNISSAKVKAIGLATETDSARPIFQPQIVAVNQASETDSSQPVFNPKFIDLGQSTETDSSIGLASRIDASISSESDSALQINPIKVVSVGQATETDTSLAVTVIDPEIIKVISQATETDSALLLYNGRILQALSEEIAFPIVSPQFISPDLSVRMLVALDDYTPAADSYLVSYSGYSIYINSSGYLCMQVGSNTFTSNVAHGLVDGQSYWLKFDWQYDFAGQCIVNFRYSTETDQYNSANVNEWHYIDYKTATQATPSYDANPLYIGGKTTGSSAPGIYYVVQINSIENVLNLNLTNESNIQYGVDLVVDSNDNRMSITGPKNLFSQNTEFEENYRYVGVAGVV